MMESAKVSFTCLLCGQVHNDIDSYNKHFVPEVEGINQRLNDEIDNNRDRIEKEKGKGKGKTKQETIDELEVRNQAIKEKILHNTSLLAGIDLKSKKSKPMKKG